MNANTKKLSEELGFRIEFDPPDEEPTQVQYEHVCWPYAVWLPPLCGSYRHLHDGGGPRVIECEDCVRALDELSRVTPGPVLRAIVRLNKAVESLHRVDSAVCNHLEILDHQELSESGPLYLANLRASVADEHARMLALMGDHS